MNRWWHGDPSERFWMEITDREDIGVDLKAPQRDDSGVEKWTYNLLREVEGGDIVLHWSTPQRALVGWSIADGECWEELITWGAHGTSARAAGVTPYPRPGIRRALTGYRVLASPVTKDDLASARAQLVGHKQALAQSRGEPLYYPFQLRADDVRATQGYLAKFPSVLLSLWPDKLSGIDSGGTRNATLPHRVATLGADYRPGDEEVATEARAPFTIDPNLVDRGTRAHALTQNLLAEWLRRAGHDPRSSSGEPMFDVAWQRDGRTYVAEVKSLSEENEERQLRLGLGQLLRYRQLLSSSRPDDQVVAVLMVERQPRDESWTRLCESLAVVLVWPETLTRLL